MGCSVSILWVFRIGSDLYILIFVGRHEGCFLGLCEALTKVPDAVAEIKILEGLLLIVKA